MSRKMLRISTSMLDHMKHGMKARGPINSWNLCLYLRRIGAVKKCIVARKRIRISARRKGS